MPSFPDDANSSPRLWSAQRIAVEVEGQEGGRVDILVDKPFARVGRDQRSEVPLSDGRLFPCHLYLHATDEGVYYVGLAGDLTSGWLLPSESMQVGPFQLRARLAEGTPGERRPEELQAKQRGSLAIPHLRVFSSSRAAKFTDLRLRRQLTLLGREFPSTRRLNHPSISRVHGAVFWDGLELWLVDFFSSNGTRLAGKKFDSGRVIPGQELKLGSVRFIYLGTKMIEAADGSALDQPVGILEHNDDAEGHDSESGLPETGVRDSALTNLLAGGVDSSCSIEQRLDALRQQCQRFEEERQQFHQQLSQERETNQERLAAVREEFANEVTALQHGSESAARALQHLSNELATTREALFARYGEVDPKSTEEATVVARADQERLQTLQEAETRWRALAEELGHRTVELQRQVAESQEAHSSLAGSVKLEREEMHRRLRTEGRAYRRRLADAKRAFAAEMAGLHEESRAVREDFQSLEAAMARVQPMPPRADAEAAEQPNGSLGEAERRHEEALPLSEARWKELSEAIEHRATELARQIVDCRQADLQMAESFKGALRDTARQIAGQQQAQALQVGAVKEELLAVSATMRDQIAALRHELERHAANFAPLTHTLAAMQPMLTRLESGEWLADLEWRWQARLQSVINEAGQQMAELKRQSSLDRQVASDRVAVLEGALAAKFADVRGGLDRLRETTEQQRGALRAISAGPTVREQADSPPSTGPLSPLPERLEREVLPRGETSDADGPRRRPETSESTDDGTSPRWVISDEVTQRLVDFKANRERTSFRPLLWSAVAATLVLIIVSGASIIQFWLNANDEIKSSEAAALPQSRLVNP